MSPKPDGISWQAGFRRIVVRVHRLSAGRTSCLGAVSLCSFFLFFLFIFYYYFFYCSGFFHTLK